MTACAKKITINDVAEAAGVSVTTVSLVLSGKGRISLATGQRVNDAIAKLGFVRNRQAASLRGGQSGVIGLIVRDLCNAFYAELTAGLTEELESQGKLIFLTQSGQHGQHMQRCFDTLIAQGVDGIIIAGSAGRGTELRDIARQKKIPLVFASRASYLDEVDMIRPDNMQAAHLVTEHLIKRGHQRIAWLGGESSSLTRAERLGGFCATLLQYGLPFHSEWIVECATSQRKAADAIIRLLQHNPTITAVLCHNSTVATGAWLGLLRAGRATGTGSIDSYYGPDIALAAFSEQKDTALDDLPLTWVSTPAREIGRCAGLRILQRGRQDVEDIHNQILPARLVETR